MAPSSISSIRRRGSRLFGAKAERAIGHRRTRKNVRAIIERLHNAHTTMGPRSALDVQMNIYFTPVDRQWVKERVKTAKAISGKSEEEARRIMANHLSFFNKEIKPQYLAIARRVAVAYAARELKMSPAHRKELVAIAGRGERSASILHRAKQLLGWKFKKFDEGYARHVRPLIAAVEKREQRAFGVAD